MKEKECLYTQSDAVAALNRVEGFDPLKFARVIENEGQESQLYLDVKYRKLWFRLVHPLGKIVSIIRSFTDNMALVEARIYLDKCDSEENYISNGFSQKFRSEDPQFGNKFLELAETAAVGRALSDAGFGLQFAEENDPEQTEAGIPIPENYTYMAPSDNQGPYGFAGQMPAGNMQMAQNTPAPNGTMNHMMSEYSKQAQANGSMIGGQQGMSYEQATQVVINVGKYKGKTMGQVALEDPGILDWYANRYQGNNHLIPAAAKTILEKALPMAG